MNIYDQIQYDATKLTGTAQGVETRAGPGAMHVNPEFTTATPITVKPSAH